MIASTGRLLISKQTQRHKERRSNSIGSNTFTSLTPSPSEGRWTVKEFSYKQRRVYKHCFCDANKYTRVCNVFFPITCPLWIGSGMSFPELLCTELAHDLHQWPDHGLSAVPEPLGCSTIPWLNVSSESLERRASHPSTGGGSVLCGGAP